MHKLKDIIAQLRYARIFDRLSTMPTDDQRKAGLDLYTTIYDEYADKVGTNVGQAEVHFTCPYPSHVTHHMLSVLNARKRNECDTLADFECTNENDDYTLTCTVNTSVKEAELVADACAMSAVLRIPTVCGDYPREAWRLN